MWLACACLLCFGRKNGNPPRHSKARQIDRHIAAIRSKALPACQKRSITALYISCYLNNLYISARSRSRLLDVAMSFHAIFISISTWRRPLFPQKSIQAWKFPVASAGICSYHHRTLIQNDRGSRPDDVVATGLPQAVDMVLIPARNDTGEDGRVPERSNGQSSTLSSREGFLFRGKMVGGWTGAAGSFCWEDEQD